MTNCWHCKKPLWFHDKWTSRKGKLIPLDKIETGYRKHKCLNNANPYRLYRMGRQKRQKNFNAQGPRVVIHG